MGSRSTGLHNPVARPAPILVAYDGSEHARHAVSAAAELFPGRSVIVLYAIQWLDPPALGGAWAGLGGPIPAPELDALVREDAERVATEGAELAREAGFDAEPRAAIGAGPIWEAIVRAADEAGAVAIVVGARGRGGIRSLVLGSVSQQVAHHARQPVVIVPAPALVEARRELAARQGDEPESVPAPTRR